MHLKYDTEVLIRYQSLNFHAKVSFQFEIYGMSEVN